MPSRIRAHITYPPRPEPPRVSQREETDARKHRRKPWSDQDYAMLRQYWGVPVRDLANMLRRSQNSVWNAAVRVGLVVGAPGVGVVP